MTTYFSRFAQWFNLYARWDVIWWFVICAQFTAAEFLGLTKHRTTFSTFIRTLLPQHPLLRYIVVGAICAVLFWHFAIQKANYE